VKNNFFVVSEKKIPGVLDYVACYVMYSKAEAPA
jgi:hypothetical protein